MKKFLTLTAVALVPAISFAQNDAEGVLERFGNLIDIVTPIVFSLALLFFFWGLATFILKSGEEKDLGKQRMIWGLVALFVMFSVWGILRFAQESLGLDASDNQQLDIPTLERR
jgi:hypothetical protein